MPQTIATVARRRDLAAQGYDSRAIARGMREGTLERISRGLYEVAAGDDFITELHTYVQVSRLVPAGVFCLTSALAIHDLTDEYDRIMRIALPRPAFEPAVRLMPVEYLHFSDGPFRMGIEEHHVEGAVLKVYSPAKTVADLFKFRNRYGADLALEALRDVWRKRLATSGELHAAAAACRVERIMAPYMMAVIS